MSLFFTTGWKYCPIRKVKQIFWSLNVIYNIMIKAPKKCLLAVYAFECKSVTITLRWSVLPFWAASPKGSMTYAFSHKGNFPLYPLPSPCPSPPCFWEEEEKILPNSAKFCQTLPNSVNFCQFLPNSALFCQIRASGWRWRRKIPKCVKA